MTPVRIAPTAFDRRLAREVARHASPKLERQARLLTWTADEHVTCLIAATFWLLSRCKGTKERAFADDALISTLVTTLAPHLLKKLFDQRRPDRAIVHGRRHGIPKSGKPDDAFPSGHAMHLGAIASVVSRFHPTATIPVWMAALVVASTRVAVLAHWASDVVAGLGLGVVSERISHWLLKRR